MKTPLHTASLQQTTSQTQQSSSQTQPNSYNSIRGGDILVGSLVFILPLLLISGVFIGRRYRAIVMQQRIRTLEKLWRLDYKRTIS